MKNVLLLSLLLSAFAFSCKNDKHTIEVIPDYDSLYISNENIDSHINLIQNEDEVQKNALNFIEQMKKIVIKDIPQETSFPLLVKVALRCYFNENGELEKVKYLDSSEFHYYIYEEKYSETTNAPLLKELIKNKLAETKTMIAYKNGKKVKYRYDFSVAFLVYQDKKVVQYMALEQQTNQHFYTIVDEMPKPIGGLERITKRVIYPEEAKKNGIEGKVFVNAVINENGNVIDFCISPYGHPNELLWKAAIDAVRKTKFIPGKLKGKPVTVRSIIPIKFELEKK